MTFGTVSERTTPREHAQKPVRLEFRIRTKWQTLGCFDSADDEHASLVLDAAEELMRTLNNIKADALCTQMRVVIDDALATELMHWTNADGWRDAITGEPA